jgi:hypothetical protein
MRSSFYTQFRKEHRQIRDLLLDLITCLLQKDLQKAGQLLDDLNRVTGPHFRYEEEALYPSLVPVFGEPYILKLLTDHDLAIARARKLKAVIDRDEPSDEDYREGLNLVRAILPHVSDCEGLTIMVEKLPRERMDFITQTMRSSISGNIPLFEWEENLRGRKRLIIK